MNERRSQKPEVGSHKKKSFWLLTGVVAQMNIAKPVGRLILAHSDRRELWVDR